MFEEPLQLFCEDLYLWSHEAKEAEVDRGENMLGDCFLHCWIRVSVCSGVYYENHTSVLLWGTGYWNGIALLSGAFIIPTNHALKQENDKQKLKIWKVYLCQNTEKSLESSSCLSLTSLYLFFLHQDDKEGGSSSWDKGPHSHTCGRTLKHTHILARTYTRVLRSAVIHLSLIPTCQPAPPTVSAPRKVTAFQWLTKAL